jgi:hypothetical protein
MRGHVARRTWRAALGEWEGERFENVGEGKIERITMDGGIPQRALNQLVSLGELGRTKEERGSTIIFHFMASLI